MNNILPGKIRLNAIITFFFTAILALTLHTGIVTAQNSHKGHNHSHDHSGHNHNHNNSGHNHNHSGHNHGHAGHDHGSHAKQASKGAHGHSHDAAGDHGHGHDDGKLDVGGGIMHHIADANELHLFGDFSIPLPCILYRSGQGLSMFMSSKFEHGHKEIDGYRLNHGKVETVDGSKFYDFSITKVVFMMMFSAILLCLIFISVARKYKKNKGAPKGLQGFIEPIYTFVRDEIARPNIGPNYEKYMPYLCTVFFFIWMNNLLGLVPFLGGVNVTGNISVTLTLSVFTLIVILASSTKHYWSHMLNPPGVPTLIKPLLAGIETVSNLLLKPVALMIRLFANITAGHIIILCLTYLIFIFAEMGGAAAGYGTSLVAVPFMLFMNVLELFVAALQAFIFTILSALFIGQALEGDHEHEEAHH